MHKIKIQYLISAVIFIVLGIAYLIYQKQNTASYEFAFETADGDFAQETDAGAVSREAREDNSAKETQEKLIYVYVCGHVKDAGVYMLAENSRRFQAIDAAGGITEDGSAEFLEMAGVLSDGERIYVPSVMEAEDMRLISSAEEESGLVNINRASKEQLMTLPGIGESRASQIIQYRDTNGPFHDIEDIMKISGIKEAAFSKIKDYICV